MTHPHTDDPGQALGRTAELLLERDRPAPPDAADLWRRGRRTTWAARTGVAAVVGVAVATALLLGWVVRSAPTTMPADSGTGRFPALVSDLFPGTYRTGVEPVFGVVEGPPAENGPRARYVIDRGGALALVHPSSSLSLEGQVSPDGTHVLLAEGIVDLVREGQGLVNLTRPIEGSEAFVDRTGAGVWSPDSRHVLVGTASGPAVVDLRADTVMGPGPGDSSVLPAGWADASTVLGVRVGSEGGSPLAEVVSRRLDAATWDTVARVDRSRVEAATTPGAASASPDGSRILLFHPHASGSFEGWAVLVDTGSGRVVSFTRAGPLSPVGWDRCPPVWQDDQPLRALDGLTRPGDGSAVLAFTGRLDLGCVAMPGNALVGSPDERSAGAVREDVWRVAGPLAALLAVVVGVWTVVALRRSRRHGERFLPMIWVQRL